jgi:ABC-2 type transport system ATP-binding protein
MPKGSIMGFIGENGAGKTTTIKLLLGLLVKDGGQIRLFGADPDRDEASELAVKEQIGVVFSENHFPEDLNARRLGRIMQRMYRQWDTDVFRGYLGDFGLSDEKAQIRTYSKGMKMKLALAVALAHDPKLLILDEPTAGLDPVIRNDFLDVLLDYIVDGEHSVFFSSHITGDIEKVADYVTFIHDGRLIFSRDKETLLEDYCIVHCGKERFQSLRGELGERVVGFRAGRFGAEALVRGALLLPAQQDDNIVCEQPTIEEIMTYFVRGFRGENGRHSEHERE